MNFLHFALAFFVTAVNSENTTTELPLDQSETIRLELGGTLEKTEIDDYKEEKNHSEAIQRILRDFEKTLEENKRLLETPGDNVNLDTDVVEVVNVTAENSTSLNITSVETDNSTTASRNRMVCNTTVTSPEDSEHVVHLLNGTAYQMALAEEFNSSVTNRSSPAICSLTLFFASWCDFSAAAAPNYNALARVFPQVKLYAVDSSLYHSLNTQHGVMAVPTLLVFHNSRPLYKYNYTEYNLASFTEFVSLLTGLEPTNVTELSLEDFLGPVPSVAVKGPNYYLLLALVFSLTCAVLHISKSPLALALLDTLRNAWREAEIQHEHTD